MFVFQRESTNLVAAFVKFLRVEGQSQTQGEAWVDLGVVGEGKDATVVDLTL